MKKKLWEKETKLNKSIERFTIGRDNDLDMYLAEFDVVGSIAHIMMLNSVDLLTRDELQALKKGLLEIYDEISHDNFKIEEGVEDIHSQIELVLTERIGNVGKKIHSGRSRNDQVLLDLRMFIRREIRDIVKGSAELFNELIILSERYKAVGMPGYTHTQAAMPSSFGMWFAAFAESLVDDLIQLSATYKIVNKNPLGSAAGYGSSFPLNRKMTTELLGFDDMNYNSIYAQIGRGKSERITSQSVASLADTCARIATDIILFISPNYDFISFPDDMTTGSSIMPHKKNPDLFELVRAKCNRLKVLPNEIMMITTNLMSGYHRDLQIIKESFIPAIFEIKDCLQILSHALKNIRVRDNILKEEKYLNIFSVEEINRLVIQGMPFREAYEKVAAAIESGTFKKPNKMSYTHEGSIGYLCNKQIILAMNNVLNSFDFDKADQALDKLLEG
jgi:argininosuccinate lyase